MAARNNLAKSSRKTSKPGPRGITDAQLMAALKRHNGLYSFAAKALGVSREAIRQRVESNPAVKTFLADLAESTIDLAENVVVKQIKDDSGPMTRWFLERKGRDRGYGTHIDGPVPPPQINTERRATIINVLVRNLDAKAQAVHVEVQEGDGRPPLAQIAKPNGKGNGCG